MASNSNTRDLQILILGKTGVGKSATANTILAGDSIKTAKRFKSQGSSVSVTQIVQKESNTINGLNLTVVDTPGVCDTDVAPDITLEEIASAIIQCPDGYDAFVIVMRYPTRLTPEEHQALKYFEELFGEDVYKYTIGIFTCGNTFKQEQEEKIENDEPATTFEDEIFKDVLSSKKGALGPIIQKFQGGVVLFDNFEKDVENRKAMVSEFLSKIDQVLHRNKNKRYDNDIFQYIRLEKQKLADQLKLDEENQKQIIKLADQLKLDEANQKQIIKDKKLEEAKQEAALQKKTVAYTKKKGCTIL